MRISRTARVKRLQPILCTGIRGTQCFGTRRTVHGAHVPGLHMQSQPVRRVDAVLAQPIGAVFHIERGRLAGFPRQFVQPWQHMPLKIQGILVHRIEAHDLAREHIATVCKAIDEAIGFQGDHQTHDRAFDQAGALDQFHKAQGRVPYLKRRQNGEHPIR